MLNLRPYQQEALDGLYGWFQINEGNPLVVLPTGAGKSLIAAKICEDAMQWERQRVLILTHVHELVEQNHKQLFRLWPEAPMGVYCAGLDKRQFHHPITFASIQSVHRRAEQIGWRDLVIIDEAHLLGDSDSSMYRKFLAELRMINPDMKVVGLSATPYRMKSGYLHTGENALFGAIAFELPISRLVKEGYLSALSSKHASTQGKTDHLALQGGEFALREAQTEFDKTEMTRAAVEEMITKGIGRKSWLIFCISIEHAEHVKDELVARGILAEMVSSKTPDAERDDIKNRFADGHIQAVVNVAVWTTGLDVVGIDMIVLLRPTMSPGLLVQMLGRGMRPVYAPGHDLNTVDGRLAAIAAGPKPNCLILDMGSNLERHGPITHIQPKDGSRKDKKARDGKVCSKCDSVNAFNATECVDCGKPFEGRPREIKHTMRAGRREAMSDQPVLGVVPVWLKVRKVKFEVHYKIASMKPPTLRVDYNCSPYHISEWLPFAHEGYARDKATKWWSARGGQLPAPASAGDALNRIDEISNTLTRQIKAKKNGNFTEITAYDLVSEPTEISLGSGNLGGKFAIQLAKENENVNAA